MRRHFVAMWWLPLLVAGLSAMMAYVYVADQPARYEATSRLLVGGLAADFDDIRASESLARTYMELAGTHALLDRAVQTSDLPMDAARLRDSVSVVTVGSSRIMIISGRHEDQQVAQQAVDAVATALYEFDASTRRQIRILDAGLPPRRVPARLPEVVTLAGLAGAGVVVGILLLFEPRTTARRQRAAGPQ